MYKRLGKIAEILIVCLIIIIGGNYIGNRIGENRAGSTSAAIAAFHTLPNDSVDVIIYGSSHAWKGLDAMEMYREYGIAAYNYGCNWQHFNSTYMYITDSLRTQSPKVVVIEMYKIDSYLYDTDLDGEILYSKQVPNSKYKRAYLKECFGNDLGRYITYYYPITAFHATWNELTEGNFFSKYDTQKWISTMGSSLTDTVKEVNVKDWHTFEQKELPEEGRKYLDEIMSLSKEYGFDVILYVAPMTKQFSYHNALTDYADENGCVFLDCFEFYDEIGFDGTTDFQNGTHLNASGSRKMADYIGQYIKEQYDIRDIREDSDSIWQQNLERED